MQKSFMIERIRRQTGEHSPISAAEIRWLGNKVRGRHLRESAQCVQSTVSKYFMAEPEKISDSMGSLEFREEVKSQLEATRKTVESELEAMTPEASALIGKAKVAGRHARAAAVFGGTWLCAGLGLHLLKNGISAEVPDVSKLFYLVSGASLLASAIAVAWVKGIQRRINSIIREMNAVRDFERTASNFVEQEWKAQVRKAFK